MKAVSKFSHITIDGIGYFEPEEKMTYDEAMEWVSTRGLRLLTRGEWCDLYDHKEEFRKSCQSGVYWTASLDSPDQDYVWIFGGRFGTTNNSNRSNSYAVRAVQTDAKVRHEY